LEYLLGSPLEFQLVFRLVSLSGSPSVSEMGSLLGLRKEFRLVFPSESLWEFELEFL
jgi:hypothetical protein